MPQRTIILDLDGVLVNGWHYRPDKRRRLWFTNLKEDLGIDPTRFITSYYGTPIERDVLEGGRTLTQAMEEVLPRLGYSGPVDGFIDYWMRKNGKLYKPMLQAVQEIKKTGTARLVVATDNERVRMDYLMTKTELNGLFDHVFYAGALGVTKSNGKFYEACNERMGFGKDAAPLFFDDNPEIVAQARKAGWEAVVFNDLEDFVDHPRVASKLLAAKPAP